MLQKIIYTYATWVFSDTRYHNIRASMNRAENLLSLPFHSGPRKIVPRVPWLLSMC